VGLPDPHGHQGLIRERATGIEPAFSAWESVTRDAPELGSPVKVQVDGKTHPHCVAR
jgi:hypothetical protein